MRRPDWWPRRLWPWETGPDRREASASAGGGGGAEVPSVPEEREDELEGTLPWPSFLDLLLESLGAASAALWQLERENDRWTVRAERRQEGWSGPDRQDRPVRGHPFTWAVREGLVLQVPAERITGGDREGWTLLIPGSGRGYLLELWFASAPGSSVREAAAPIQVHLSWLCEATRSTRETP